MLKVTLEQPSRFTCGDTPESAAGPGEALVAVRRVGVCGSDVHAFHGRHPCVRYPIILGHELSGVVLEATANDRGIEPGVCVSIEPFRPCGHCVACKVGKTNCCANMNLIGIHSDGGMVPRLAVPLQYLHRSDTLSLDQLATIEPLSIGEHAVERSAIKAGESMLIVGAGPIGLAALQFALLEGGEITVLEINDNRRKWVADTFGVDTISARDDARYALVIDASGNAEAMSESFYSVQHGGRLVFVGVINAQISFDDALLHDREITLLASRNSCDAFPRIIRLIEQGRFDPSIWITHRMSLPDVAGQFGDIVSQPGVVKPMIEVPQE